MTLHIWRRLILKIRILQCIFNTKFIQILNGDTKNCSWDDHRRRKRLTFGKKKKVRTDPALWIPVRINVPTSIYPECMLCKATAYASCNQSDILNALTILPSLVDFFFRFVWIMLYKNSFWKYRKTITDTLDTQHFSSWKATVFQKNFTWARHFKSFRNMACSIQKYGSEEIIFSFFPFSFLH